MSNLFAAASSEFLTVASAPVTGVPLTMACWFNSSSTTTAQVMIDLHASGSGAGANCFFIRLVSGAVVRAQTNGTPATTVATYVVDTWNHACGVFTAVDNRAVFLNGANKVSSIVSATPAGIDELNIAKEGGTADSSFVAGMIAEVGIWNIALSDAEVALLALGYSPLLVRPEALVFYLPMIALGGGGTQLDWVGNRTMTETNTPATAQHPLNIIYPSSLTTGWEGMPAYNSIDMTTGIYEFVGLLPTLEQSLLPRLHVNRRDRNLRVQARDRNLSVNRRDRILRTEDRP